MVARFERIRTRTPEGHSPLRITRRARNDDETDPSTRCKSLVQIDAHRAHVAFSRPLRVPDVRAVAWSVLGATRTDEAGAGSAERNAGTNSRALRPETGFETVRSRRQAVTRVHILSFRVQCRWRYSPYSGHKMHTEWDLTVFRGDWPASCT